MFLSRTFVPLLLVTTLYLLNAADATNIKFTKGTKDMDTPAHNAPRSAKYWLENNIERPAYGKTDMEVWLETSNYYKQLLPRRVVNFVVGWQLFARKFPFWINYKSVLSCLVIATVLIYERWFSEASKRRAGEVLVEKSIADKPNMVDARLARFTSEPKAGDEDEDEEEDEDEALNSKPATSIGSALARETAQEEQKRRIEERIEKLKNTPVKKVTLKENSLMKSVDGGEEEDVML